MSARVLIFSAAVIGAGVLALILVTSHESERSSPTSPAARGRDRGTGPGATGPSRRDRRTPPESERKKPTGPRPDRPELKVAESTSDPGFAAEERDEAWAKEKEREVRDRVDGLLKGIRGADAKAVDVARVECKSTRCRLRVSGADGQRFMQFVEALQSSDGFYGSASQLMLQSYTPATEAGGRASVTVVLVYDRASK